LLHTLEGPTLACFENDEALVCRLEMPRWSTKCIYHVLRATHGRAYYMILHYRWGTVLEPYWDIDDGIPCWHI
jgi:hypothetical protein